MADQVIPSTSGNIIIRRGPRGAAGPAGPTGATGSSGADGASGSGTIAATGNLIKGDGVDAGIDSTIDPADVIDLIANNTGTNTGDQTDVTGNAGTVTTNANLTGDVTSVGNASTVANVPATATFVTDPTTIPSNEGGWDTYWVTGSDDTETGQSLVDIDGLVSGTLTNGARYEIEAKLMMTTSADTTGVKIAVHAGGSGSAGTLMVAGQATGNSAGALAGFTLSAMDTATTAFLVFSSGSGIVRLSGFFTTRSSGTATVSLQQLKVTSGTATTLISSVMRIRKAHI